MILLDTDVLSLFFAGHPSVLERHRRAAEEVAITIVTRIESYQGRFASVLKAASGRELLRAQEWLLRLDREIVPFRVIAFDAAAAAEFDRLRADRRLKKIGRADLLIASIALAQRATLVTRNVRHFRPVLGLTLDNWTA